MREAGDSPPVPEAGTPAQVSRGAAVVACLGAAALCLAYGRWRSGLPDWWREYGGGIPYVLFWIAFAFVLVPSRRFAGIISAGATLATCVLEVFQLWKPSWLSGFRGSVLGAALLGGTFTWSDFPPYVLGGALGYGMLRLVSRWERRGD